MRVVLERNPAVPSVPPTKSSDLLTDAIGRLAAVFGQTAQGVDVRNLGAQKITMELQILQETSTKGVISILSGESG
jgi:hypothetical protein